LEVGSCLYGGQSKHVEREGGRERERERENRTNEWELGNGAVGAYVPLQEGYQLLGEVGYSWAHQILERERERDKEREREGLGKYFGTRLDLT